MKFYSLILIFGLSYCTAKTQAINTPEDSLRFYGDAMFTLKISKHKAFAETKFTNLVQRLVHSNKDSIYFKFHPAFVVTESPDQEIKIISWQIELDSSYHYYAYFFTKNSNPIFINSKPRNIDRINYETFDKDNWYGAMYYHFLPVKINGFYTVLGYRFSNEGNKYRIIEPIKLAQDNLEFGSPIFRIVNSKNEEDLLYRKIISYSPSANIIVKYDEESKLILFDHVEQFTDPKTGQIIRAADGTFESFEYKDQYWEYNSYHQLEKLKAAPREKPVLGGSKKDIFGKEKRE
jgi:hypothetical protein